MTIPETQLKKWIKVFRYRDADGDGFLTEKQYAEAAQKFVDVYGEKAKPIRKIVPMIWSLFTYNGYRSRINEQEFIECFTHNFLNDLEAFKYKIETYLNLAFEAIDTNGDGVISLSEYSVYQTSFGITNQDYIEHLFNKLDVNGDGVISRQEFVGETMELTFTANPEKIPELYNHELAKNFRKK